MIKTKKVLRIEKKAKKQTQIQAIFLTTDWECFWTKLTLIKVPDILQQYLLHSSSTSSSTTSNSNSVSATATTTSIVTATSPEAPSVHSPSVEENPVYTASVRKIHKICTVIFNENGTFLDLFCNFHYEEQANWIGLTLSL